MMANASTIFQVGGRTVASMRNRSALEERGRRVFLRLAGQTSRTADPYSYRKYEYSANYYLESGRQQRSIHVAIANPGNRGQFEGDDNYRRDKSGMKNSQQRTE